MAKKTTFEDSLRRLEDITKKLESGELTLEESLKIFDEGIKLTRFCNKKLEDAQQKVNLLITKDGETESIPFNEPDTNIE